MFLPAKQTNGLYGLGDEHCGPLMQIPPILELEDGSRCMNPDFAVQKRFTIQATPVDTSLAASAEATLRIENEGEENGFGDIVITELFMRTSIVSTIEARDITVTIKDPQSNRTLMNVPAYWTLVMGTSWLNCCLPYPILLQPRQSLFVTLKNNHASNTYTVNVAARGARWLPYHEPELRQKMLQCWNSVPSFPYWMSLDDGQVTATANSTTRNHVATSPGCYFEIVYTRVDITAGAGASVECTDLDIIVREGRNAKAFMDRAINMSLFAPYLTFVSGLPGGIKRPAFLCHCPEERQILKPNTKLYHDITNNHASDNATVRLTYVGIAHCVDNCPPAEDLERVRSGMFGSPAFADEDQYVCPLPGVVQPELPLEVFSEPVAAPAPGYVQQYAEPPAPEPRRIVKTWRPGKRYYGPGSTGALPHNQMFAEDQHGQKLVVIVDQQGNVVREAEQREVPGWVFQHGALNGLGSGEWERI